ncbi:MAG: DUF368 domain-containing protein [Bacteroidales bacterium]|nr:DUF368 domain-containing protein [Bacteroidales bacterium]
MKDYFILIVKGLGMGVANVIPGVSGGTIALITGIFERLIHAIKSINLKSARLLISGNFALFAKHTDLYFLAAVFSGVILAIVTIAKLFDFLFTHYPVYIWSFFFGLVAASVFFVGKTVSKWKTVVVGAFILGTGAAAVVSILNPATENSSFSYLLLCGVVAVCSMILPGLSGSFVLILMGNYQLVAIDAINNRDIEILVPVLIGAAFGLIAFSHFLSWVFKKFRDVTIALLTGFIFGSLSILWPWQKSVFMRDASGAIIEKHGKPVVEGYEKFIPHSLDGEVILGAAFVLAGILSIWLLERAAKITPNAGEK